MFGRLHHALTAFIVLLSMNTKCQQPQVIIQTFEYLWVKNDPMPGSYIILPSVDDQAKNIIRNNFNKAFKTYWNISLPDVPLTVKHLPFFVYNPKFKTSLKDKDPGKWYLFLQVYDKSNSQVHYTDNTEQPYTVDVRCKLITGNDSVILDKMLTVNIYQHQPPADQVIVKRLPSYPADFANAFDSIAKWIFQPQQVGIRSITLKPACIFPENRTVNKPLQQLTFKSDKENIQLLSAPEFSFKIGETKVEKTDIKRNFGGNALSGALTLFTGIGTSKSKSYFYRATIPFKEAGNEYNCTINYIVSESKDLERKRNEDRSFTTESSDYAVEARGIDPKEKNFIIKGTDTLAGFTIQYPNDNKNIMPDKMWDGSDSTTITYLPPEWNNKNHQPNMSVAGTMGTNSFLFKSINETTKHFYINDNLVAIMYGNNRPVKADILMPLSPLQLKLFTILSSLPYSYYNSRYGY